MRDSKYRYSQWVCGVAMAAVVLTAGTARGNAWRTDRFCAPTVAGWPATQPTANDGQVQGDLGYVQDYRFIFADGTHDVQAAIQAAKAGDDSKLWMAFELFNASYDVNNFLVVAFDTGTGGAAVGTNGPYKIFVVSPMQGDGQGGAGHTPVSVQYYTQAAGAINPATWVSGTPPAGTVMGYAPSTDPVTHHLGWQLEMELPVAALGLPTNRDFGVYMNLLPVDSGLGTAVELRWPDGATPAPRITRDITNLPQPATWGRMSLASNTCTGVYIESWNGDIYTSIDNPTGNNGTQLTYSTTRDNYFHATVRNDGADASGVTASFKIANFGTSYDAWSAPVSLTGTALDTIDGPSNITSGGTHEYRIGPWRLVASQAAVYQHTHQCILVELDSSVNGTAFRVKSGFTNADFDVASTVQTTAEINTKGLGPPPAGMANHQFAYYVKPAIQFAFSDGRHEEIPANRITLQLVLVFHAYHFTGDTITLRNKRYDIVEPGPGFTITYQHVLGEGFDKEFKQRHEKLTALAERARALVFDDRQGKAHGPTQGQAAAIYRQVNAELAVDSEQPKPDTWEQKFDGLTLVPNTRGFWFRAEVPATGIRNLVITATAKEGGGGSEKICCVGNTQKATTPAAAMLMIVGVWAHRRRRREDERDA